MEGQATIVKSPRPTRQDVCRTVHNVLKRMLDLEWHQIKSEATIVASSEGVPRLQATVEQVRDIIAELKRLLPGLELEESIFTRWLTVHDLVTHVTMHFGIQSCTLRYA